MKNIEWLFFDMGGVILNDDQPETMRQVTLFQVGKKYIPNLTMQDIYNAWLDASAISGQLRIEALRILFKNSPDLSEAEKEYKNLDIYDYQALSLIRPEAKNILTKLSGRYKLGITANQNVKTTDLIDKEGLLPLFSHKKMSAHMGLEKPDPKFFLKVLEDSGAKAEQSAIIDDNYFRGLAPAKKLGMTTVLFERPIIPFPKTAAPDFTISKLDQLLNLFID